MKCGREKMFFGVYWWICGVFGVGRKIKENPSIFYEIGGFFVLNSIAIATVSGVCLLYEVVPLLLCN